MIDGIIARKRHVYLCTNALLLDDKVFGRVPPHRRLTINVHLDGLRETHDYVCAREGVFDRATEMIAQAKQLGYHVITNTTIFKETDIGEVEQLCEQLFALGIDGMLITPGYQYESVEHDLFLTREGTQEKFRRVLEISRALSPDLDADVLGVRGRFARLRLLAVEHGDLHSQLAGRALAT